MFFVGGEVSLFVMHILACVMIVTVSSICLIASKLLRFTLDEFITESCFSWTDIKGVFHGESIIDYRYSSFVLDMVVTNRV